MSTRLPITFSVSPLTPGKSYNPQEFANALAARLAIDSQSQLSFFVSGPAQPSSDVGPWLKDNVTWYSWSSTVGAYVPQPMEYLSLKYLASDVAPSHTDYTFWIKLDGTGKAQSIQYWSGGAWKDVYEDTFANIPTTAQMNTAISTAISGAFTGYAFRANSNAGSQIYTAGTGDTQITFNDVMFDPNSVFASNVFTAQEDGYYNFHVQMYIALDTGAPVDIDRQIKLTKNGFAFARTVVIQSSDTGGFTISISGSVELAIGDVVDAKVYVTSTGASTWSILGDATSTYFEGHRIIT